MPLRSATSKDSTYFDLFAEAGANISRAADLLERMFDTWPEDTGIAREILKAEQEGDRITQQIARRLNSDPPRVLESSEVYSLATRLDDVIDDIEETADFMGLYKIEAPMEQGHVMSRILANSCTELAGALDGPPVLE